MRSSPGSAIPIAANGRHHRSANTDPSSSGGQRGDIRHGSQPWCPPSDVPAKVSPNFSGARDATRQRLLNVVANRRCDRTPDPRWIGFKKTHSLTVVEKFTLGESASEVSFDLWNKATMECTRRSAPRARIVFFGINSREDLKAARKLRADAVFTDVPAALLGD